MPINSQNLRKVEVEYIKGKYAYKQRLNGLSPSSYKILFSSPIDAFEVSKVDILTLYDVERKKGRLDYNSRKAIKGLQMNLNSPSIIKSKGVTHVIVYESIKPE